MPDDPKPDPVVPPDPKPDPVPDPAAELGEGGKAALDAERKARAAAEKATKALEKKLADLEALSMTEQEKAVATAKAEGLAEGTTTANARILRSEVKAIAGGKLADPADAVNLLDLSEFTVSDDGDVDTKAIASAIDALVKAKPYLAAAGSKPAPLPGGGATPSEGFDPNDWLRSKAGVTGR